MFVFLGGISLTSCPWADCGGSESPATTAIPALEVPSRAGLCWRIRRAASSGDGGASSELMSADRAYPRSAAAGAHLVVVPHDVLHFLPFHALFDGERYLITSSRSPMRRFQRLQAVFDQTD